jgi:hypothetical protein
MAHRVISLRRKIWSLSGNSGHRWIFACDGSVANDPQRPLAVLCSNGSDAGFSPY